MHVSEIARKAILSTVQHCVDRWRETLDTAKKWRWPISPQCQPIKYVAISIYDKRQWLAGILSRFYQRDKISLRDSISRVQW